VTPTTADALADPPAPVHVRLNVFAAVTGPEDWVPLVGFEPLHPPDALQVVALVLVQLRLDDEPLATEDGVAVSVMDGRGV
jgi:hypothetical protein